MAMVLILAWRNIFVCVPANHFSGSLLSNKNRRICHSWGKLYYGNVHKFQMFQFVLVGPKIDLWNARRNNVVFYDGPHSNLNSSLSTDDASFHIASVRWRCIIDGLIFLNVRSQHENQYSKGVLSHWLRRYKYKKILIQSSIQYYWNE